MRTFSFIWLMIEIFKKSPADIRKIQSMGLLAVKIAQMFALRIDFLSPEKCTQLSRLLQDNTTIDDVPFDDLILNYETMHLLQSLETIDKIPFASASVAQVHMGTLPSGNRVAIKILKHDYVRNFEQDVQKVIALFKIAIFFYPKLRKVANPVALLEMIQQDTLNELDLRREYQHQQVLRDIYNAYCDDVDLSDMAFQKLYPEFLDKGILVSDFIGGATFETLLSEGKLPYEVLLRLFHLHGFFVFVVGEFHGDLHPGNVMLWHDRIYFIDCGAIGRVEKDLREGLFYFMKYLSEFDFVRCAGALQSMSEVQLSPEAYARFEEKFLLLYQDFALKTVSEVSLTMQMMKTIQLGVHSGMSFSKGMFPIIKSLMYLDGMVRRANPDAILMKDMRPFVAELEQYILRRNL